MSNIFPVIDVTLAKQGDGSHVVTVVHSQGVNTDVTFPYSANGMDMAVDYLKHINEIRQEQAREAAKKAAAKANVFGIAVPTPAPTVVNTPPAPAPVVAPVAAVEPPAPTAPVVAQQSEPEVVAPAVSTEVSEEKPVAEEEPAPAQE